MTQVTIEVLEAEYPEKTLMQKENYVTFLPVGHLSFSDFSFSWPTFQCLDSGFLDDQVMSSLWMAQDTIDALNVRLPQRKL